MQDLSNTTAIVTGAGSGNGRAIAERLLNAGANVVLADVNLDAVKAVAANFDLAHPVQADVTDETSMKDAVADAVKQFGGLDTLVNNAGIVKFSNFDELSVEEWDLVFKVNSTGPFVASKAAVPAMEKTLAKKGGNSTGAIVNITSVEAHIIISSSGHPQIHYNASKGALLQLTRGLSVELAPRKIRVNAVAPGFIETPFTAAALERPEFLSWLVERTPMGRIGQPQDVANAVAFLANSEQANWITGSTLFVDGGWTVY